MSIRFSFRPDKFDDLRPTATSGILPTSGSGTACDWSCRFNFVKRTEHRAALLLASCDLLDRTVGAGAQNSQVKRRREYGPIGYLSKLLQSRQRWQLMRDSGRRRRARFERKGTPCWHRFIAAFGHEIRYTIQNLQKDFVF